MLNRFAPVCALALALAACHSSQPPANSPAVGISSAAPAPAGPATAAAAGSAPAPAAPAAGSSAPAAAEEAPASSAQATAPPPFHDDGQWVEGKNYFVIDPKQPTDHPDKIEVTEVFSYGCPACNSFHATVDRIAHSLPPDAVMNYVAAGFRPDENWLLYQRAYYATKALGIADKTYDASFEGVWKSGEIGSYDLASGQLNPPSTWPDLDKLASFYSKYGVDPKEFIAVANSFSTQTQMKRADQRIAAYGVEGTPTIVINGHYRFDPGSAGGYAKSIELTRWLIAKEAAGR